MRTCTTRRRPATLAALQISNSAPTQNEANRALVPIPSPNKSSAIENPAPRNAARMVASRNKRYCLEASCTPWSDATALYILYQYLFCSARVVGKGPCFDTNSSTPIRVSEFIIVENASPPGKGSDHRRKMKRAFCTASSWPVITLTTRRPTTVKAAEDISCALMDDSDSRALRPRNERKNPAP